MYVTLHAALDSQNAMNPTVAAVHTHRLRRRRAGERRGRQKDMTRAYRAHAFGLFVPGGAVTRGSTPAATHAPRATTPVPGFPGIVPLRTIF